MSDSPAAPLPPAQTIAAWRVLLRGAGALLALGVVCVWAAKGANRGWTKNQIPVSRIDPITEIPFVTYEKRFVPGVDYLAGGVLVGAAVFGATFLGRRGRELPRP